MTGTKTIGLLGKKLGMTQIFLADGTCVPVTIVQAGPCKVLQVKTAAAAELPEGHRTAANNRGKKGGKQPRPRQADGYYAVRLGFENKPARLCSKAELGDLKHAGLDHGMRFVKEFRLTAAPTQKPGDEVNVSVFDGVKFVDVTGVTKGRGWAGTIKRWSFSRQPTSHGNSLNHRTGGGLGRQHSISSGVPKGKRMAGHYGCEQVTVQRLEVVKTDTARNLVFLKGAVPGFTNGYLVLKKTIKNERLIENKPGLVVKNAAAKSMAKSK
ncbi:MAG: 50S ribosomal protein L3 [Planctomycetes bacterium]|nr:50S ribosomal protein L3 [Planctomycetota bacterium]MCC7396989.1 50S ribosomal protein L3 [Planctomycetota bacterium]